MCVLGQITLHQHSWLGWEPFSTTCILFPDPLEPEYCTASVWWRRTWQTQNSAVGKIIFWPYHLPSMPPANLPPMCPSQYVHVLVDVWMETVSIFKCVCYIFSTFMTRELDLKDNKTGKYKWERFDVCYCHFFIAWARRLNKYID